MASFGRMDEFDERSDTIGTYLKRLRHYFDANSVPERKQVAVLLSVIGKTTFGVLCDLVSPSEPGNKSFVELEEILKTHYSPKTLVIAERFKFHGRIQKGNESISEFSVAIKHLAQTCNFGAFLPEALRDQFVSGLRSSNIQQKLIEAEYTLDQAYALATTLEQAEKQQQLFHVPQSHNNNSGPQASSEEVYKVRVQQKHQPGTGAFGTSVGQRECYRCGSREHIAVACPYSQYKCHTCSKVGHLAKKCRKQKVAAVWGVAKQDSRVPIEGNRGGEGHSKEVMELFNVQHPEGVASVGYQVLVRVEGKPLVMQVDTGSAVTLVSNETYLANWPNLQLSKSKVKLRTYFGDDLPVKGGAQVEVEYKEQRSRLQLLVVDSGQQRLPSLLGRDWLGHIQLDWNSICAVSVSQIHLGRVQEEVLRGLLDKYAGIFSGAFGEIKNFVANFTLKEGASPVFLKARTVPFALRDKVDKELQNLEKQHILDKVEYSSWASPLVIVPKANGEVRICADFKGTVNPRIELTRQPLPGIDDVFASVANGRVFSVLDLSNAYQQLVVGKESQELVTVNTHRGLYRYRRMPFGLSSAPGIFQAVIEQMLQGIPGVVAYLDDILITGGSVEEGLERLEAVLARLQEQGVQVKKQKCHFLKEEVQFLGYVISREGIRPAGDLQEAIKKAPVPTTVTQLKAYLGLINFYARFVQGMSGKLKPLYNLLAEGAAWTWDANCQQIFEESKEWILQAPVLVPFDPQKPLIVASDASQYGVGAVLSHRMPDGTERPICFASKTLSKAEQGYCQLQKEALSIIFAVQKFHKYLYGHHFTLYTDHRPLTTIFGPKKAVPSLAAARLQRWALLLTTYNYSTEYKKGEDMGNADALSRLPLAYEQSVEQTVFLVQRDIPIKAEEIAKETEKDEVLKRVKNYTMYGWLQHNEVASMKPYVTRRDELAIEDNCIMWADRVVVPQVLRETVLQMLHEGHPGVVRMKMLARSYVWWPGMDNEIDDTVKKCTACQLTRHSIPQKSWVPWPEACRVGERVHVDFAEREGKRLLILVDAYSKWVEVWPMQSTVAEKTIEKLRTAFAAYGLPENLVADNGPQFRSEEFQQFCKANAINLQLTPPFHPQSNGAAERTVQSVKTALLKQAVENGLTGGTLSLQHTLDKWLFAYRNTPHTTTGKTPAEMFLKRKPRTQLLLVKPNLPEYHKKPSRLRGGPGLRFSVHDLVWVKCVRGEQTRWILGRIVEVVSMVTYRVKVGEIIRFCHQDHLRRSHLQEEIQFRSRKGAAGAVSGTGPRKIQGEEKSEVGAASPPGGPATTRAAEGAVENRIEEGPSEAPSTVEDSEGEEFRGFGEEITVLPTQKLLAQRCSGRVRRPPKQWQQW
ncbi:uncharacterized protein K02A2.6-like [Bacillus rossius redtenbacheri]|uniref:uncharacterized protein K02A2.6-like n=1 Tax=Bacillus rossius redtenbacheri TaxID=93214 RepID=UPI002FDDE79E